MRVPHIVERVGSCGEQSCYSCVQLMKGRLDAVKGRMGILGFCMYVVNVLDFFFLFVSICLC